MEDTKTCLEKQPLSQEMLEKMNAYWRAANYLSAGQLYLLDNPLLKEPLTMDQIKKKIVGHWGTVPGQNFIYVHCNREIKRYDLDMILLSGPGHGGNFLIANTYLEGSYSEVYPNISQDEEDVQAVLIPMWSSESLCTRATRIYQRRWRAWILYRSCIRCCIRQPGSDRNCCCW